MVEVMKIMATSSKGPMQALLHSGPTCTQVAPAAGHHQPMPLLQTPGHSRASLDQSLVGSLFLFLGPSAHKVLFVPSRSLFPQSCVSSGVSWWG